MDEDVIFFPTLIRHIILNVKRMKSEAFIYRFIEITSSKIKY